MDYSLEQCDGNGTWTEIDCARDFLEARDRGWGLTLATSRRCTRIRIAGVVEVVHSRREICRGCPERLNETYASHRK